MIDIPGSAKTSLLARIAGKFAYHPENVATEALGDILGRSDMAKDALKRMLQDGGVDIGQVAYVRTQASGMAGAGRPDLAILDAAGKERVLIEAKFMAGLTEKQPTAYLARLPDGAPSALLVVAPEHRRERLWAELLQAGKIEGFGSEAAGFKIAPVRGSKKSLMLTSWGFLIQRLRDNSPDAVEDIDQLEGLCMQEGGTTFPRLRSDQFGPEVPLFMINMRNLIEESIALAESNPRRFLSRSIGGKRLQAAPAGGGFGWNMLLAGAKAWLGVNYDLWARHAPTPLWLVFLHQKGTTVSLREVYEKLTPMREKRPQESWSETHRQLVPIRLPTSVDYNETKEAVVSRLGEVAKLIQAKPRGRPRKSRAS